MASSKEVPVCDTLKTFGLQSVGCGVGGGAGLAVATPIRLHTSAARGASSGPAPARRTPPRTLLAGSLARRANTTATQLC